MPLVFNLPALPTKSSDGPWPPRATETFSRAMSAAKRLDTSDKFCFRAISTQRSSLIGSGFAISKGSIGRARESNGSPMISRSSSSVEASARLAAITAAAVLS